MDTSNSYPFKAMTLEQFKGYMTTMRTQSSDIIKLAQGVKRELADSELSDKEEAAANITLAYRHLEDASMRFGKAIQAVDGGVSPLGGPNSIQY